MIQELKVNGQSLKKLMEYELANEPLWASDSGRSNMEGTYTGTFTVDYFMNMREGWSSIGTVTLELMNGKYTYTSDIPPKLYTGNYSISNDKIIFDYDKSPEYPGLHVVSPYFDINLILNGEYDYTFDGKRLKFSATKNYDGYYEYDLVKVEDGKECVDVLCTEIFITISLKLEYPNGQPVLLDDYKVFWVSEKRYLDKYQHWNEPRVYGHYCIVNDGMKQELFNRKEIMHFTGYLNGKIVCECDVPVSADCCHVVYLGSAPLVQVVN